jgi:predicted XRE-type DNA-binding protein
MAKRAKTPMIERGSGNVFADLGFEDAGQLLAKAQLVAAISEAMEATGITQTELARLAGIDQPKVSRLLRGLTDGFSSDRLMRILTSLDQDVNITVRPRPRNEHRHAHVSVAVFHAI